MNEQEITRLKSLLYQTIILNKCNEALCCNPDFVCKLLDISENRTNSELSKAFLKVPEINAAAIYSMYVCCFLMPKESLFEIFLKNGCLKNINKLISEKSSQISGFENNEYPNATFIRNSIAHNHFNVVDGYFILENHHRNKRQSVKILNTDLGEIAWQMREEVIIPFINGRFDKELQW